MCSFLLYQAEPSSIWSTITWQDISNDYDGLFFRALGGGSEAFGNTQGENTQRLTEVNTISTDNVGYTAHICPNNEWSGEVLSDA